MGDLNMHYLAEDAVVVANGLLDCWAETHFGSNGDGELGFTFDALSNSMIPRYIPGERRRMRLDRILCGKGGALVPARPCGFWGHSVVDEKQEIFISDHYGLVQDFSLALGAGFTGNADVHQHLEANGRRDLEPNPFSAWRFIFILLRHSVWLSLRAIGLAFSSCHRPSAL